MLLAAAVPSCYLATILYSGLELYVYAKITGEKDDDSETEGTEAESEKDIESGTQLIKK